MHFTLTLVIIIFGHTALASTEVFFSPADSTKKRLVTAIHAAENSLDIATFQFTSVDVAEALVEAKNRGTRIRILADENESQNGQSVIPFLQGEGLDVKYMKGRFGGGMHHSFVIADSKAVFTGSYNLTEYSDKFNFENAIFTDEPRLVTKYQTQFDKLYGELLAKIPSPTTETAVTEKEPKHFIGLSISHLGKILGEDSPRRDGGLVQLSRRTLRAPQRHDHQQPGLLPVGPNLQGRHDHRRRHRPARPPRNHPRAHRQQLSRR